MSAQHPTAEPDYQVTQILDTDAYGVYAGLSAEDRAVADRVRSFLTPEVLAEMRQAWDQAEYPCPWSSRWVSSTYCETAFPWRACRRCLAWPLAWRPWRWPAVTAPWPP